MKFLAAFHTNVKEEKSSFTDTEVVEKFMSNYEAMLCHNNFSDEKKNKVRANLRETAARLFDAKVPVIETQCTFWKNDNTLCFLPARIDLTQPVAEQQSSLRIMHAKTCTRIHIIIDFEKLTWNKTLQMANQAGFENVVDGLRMWSTLPYKIEQIGIITLSNNIIINQIANLFLSKKLRQRFHVFESWYSLQESSFFPNCTCDREGDF